MISASRLQPYGEDEPMLGKPSNPTLSPSAQRRIGESLRSVLTLPHDPAEGHPLRRALEKLLGQERRR